MRIFLSIKYHSDRRNPEHIEAISNALRQQGHETVCVVRDVEHWGRVELSPADLMAKTFQEIDACDLLLVDLAEKGIGVGIEAGYAYARRVPQRFAARTPATAVGLTQHPWSVLDVLNFPLPNNG